MGRVSAEQADGRGFTSSDLALLGHRALRSTPSTALTAHRAIIHYRRLRFAYPKGEGLCAYGAKHLDKLQFTFWTEKNGAPIFGAPEIDLYFISSGMKLSVSWSMPVSIRMKLTPAAISIRLEARLPMVPVYLSER